VSGSGGGGVSPGNLRSGIVQPEMATEVMMRKAIRIPAVACKPTFFPLIAIHPLLLSLQLASTLRASAQVDSAGETVPFIALCAVEVHAVYPPLTSLA